MAVDSKRVPRIIMACLLLGAAAKAAPPDQHVVYHIDSAEAGDQQAALRTVGNHLSDVGDENVDARVVIQGNGVSMLLPSGSQVGLLNGRGDTRTQTQIEDLTMRGVQFRVCRNSLQRRQVDASYPALDLDSKQVVQSGLAEIVRLQQAGYTYVKL